MSPSPPPDITPLAEAASGMHELFEAYVQAGFTEDQALSLIVALISTGR